MSEPSRREQAQQPNILDVALKVLGRHYPAALLRLAGPEVAPESVRCEDVSVTLPEFRADQVLLVLGEERLNGRRIWSTWHSRTSGSCGTGSTRTQR